MHHSRHTLRIPDGYTERPRGGGRGRPLVPPIRRADRPTPPRHHTRKGAAAERVFCAPALSNASFEAGHPPASRGRRLLCRGGRDTPRPDAAGLRGAVAAGAGPPSPSPPTRHRSSTRRRQTLPESVQAPTGGATARACKARGARAHSHAHHQRTHTHARTPHGPTPTPLHAHTERRLRTCERRGV